MAKSDTLTEIEDYIKKARSVTCYDIANRFGVRMSVARQILREKEAEGIVIPYLRESGFVVYTTPAEIEKRERDRPIMIADVLEDVASSVPKTPIITDEMDAALLAASVADTVKPSKLARQRRELGERKEKKRERRPEVVVEPLPEAVSTITPPQEEKLEEPPKKIVGKKPKKPKKEPEKKKKPAKKRPPKKEEPVAKKPAKKVTKKAEEREEKPKKAPAKKVKMDLSDLSGVGPKTQEKLIAAGFKTVAKIAKAKPDKLASKVDGLSEKSAADLIKKAQKAIS